MQIDKCKMEKMLLKNACKREADLIKWVSKSVIPSRHALKSTELLIQDIRSGAAGVMDEIDVLKEHTCLLAIGLHKWNEKFDQRKDMVRYLKEFGHAVLGQLGDLRRIEFVLDPDSARCRLLRALMQPLFSGSTLSEDYPRMAQRSPSRRMHWLRQL